MTFKNDGGITAYDVSVVGRTYCSGTFYHVRHRHSMFRDMGPYVAAPKKEL
jgi:hypothetical protein